MSCQLDDGLRELCRRHHGMVPIRRELLADTLTPVTAFLRLRAADQPAFLLESVEGGERIGRHSFLGANPLLTFRGRGETTEIVDRDGNVLRREERGFFDVIEEEMKQYRAAERAGMPPFAGGVVGVLGYDAIRLVERIPDSHPRDDDVPEIVFGLYADVVAFDHARHRVLIIANMHFGDEERTDELIEAKYADAVRRLDALEERLQDPDEDEELSRRIPSLEKRSIADHMRSNFTREDFEGAVRHAKEYIAAGDAFQIVLSQCFEREVEVKPFAVYRMLRATNPSPYLFYFQFEDLAVFGSSPEILVRVENRIVTVRPIAGTRPRGESEERDLELEQDLLADEKELAEHRMLVDLGRNDVGRVAKFGTVHLAQYQTIERYSHVMHIVSQVEGELRDDLSALDAFKAGFPAGTVSGAPKIRAMEIIDELEPTRRGIYSGAVGYLDFAGNLDTGIAIRTLVFRGNRARVQAGAGIVADSVPETEYFETIHKATALSESIRLAEAAYGVEPAPGEEADS